MLLQHRREWAPASASIPARVWHHDRWHLTSVHLHIPGAAEQKHTEARAGQVRVAGSAAAAGSTGSQLSWQGCGGPQCPGGACIHAGPRVPSQLMALEIGASAALEQPEKPRQARGPGSVTRTLRLAHCEQHQAEPNLPLASNVACTPVVRIHSLTFNHWQCHDASWKEQLECATPMCLGSVLE